MTTTGTYFDGEVACGRPVSIEFTDDGRLCVAGENVMRESALPEVRVSDRLGDIPRFIYLPNDAVIETPDNATVDAALARRQQSRGARLIHALESQQWIAVVGCFVLVATIAILGYFGPPWLARTVARRVPADADQRIGKAALLSIRPYFSATKLTAAERERVRRQLLRLQADPKAPVPRLEFMSMKGGQPNAFALPGNVIVVTDELVQIPVTDDEIAAVLAHELGHLERRHGLQSLLRKSFALLIVAAVTGDVSTLTSFAGTIPMTILTAGYSRDLEREADRYALDLLRARHINPRAFVTVLVKLEASGDSLQRSSTYLSTHPATDERLALFGGITPAERRNVLSEPWLARASEADARGDYTSTIADADRALEQNPSAKAYILRARARLQHNDGDGALADVTKALELDPKSVDAYSTRAEILTFTSKKYDEAIAAARKALELDPKNSTATAALGAAEVMKGVPAARTDLDRAIAADAANFRGWAYRAYLRQKQEDYAGALADYDEAVKHAPELEWLRYDRGILRVHQNDYRGALADFAHVKDPARHTAQLLAERGFAEQQLGKVDAAISDYGRAIEKAPPAPQLANLHVQRGAAYTAQRKFHLAVADFGAAIAIDPKNGSAYFNRAAAYRQSGEAEKALTDLERAASFGFTPAYITGLRAELNWDLGRYDAALADFTQMIETGTQPHALEARGLIEFSLGHWDRAEADLTTYLTMEKQGLHRRYMQFFLLLARRSNLEDDQAGVFAAEVSSWEDCWAKVVGQYLSGDITESEFLAAASTGDTPTPKERRCEACYYIGATHLLAGDVAKARDYFHQCVSTGVTDYYEYKIARAELPRLRAAE